MHVFLIGSGDPAIALAKQLFEAGNVVFCCEEIHRIHPGLDPKLQFQRDVREVVRPSGLNGKYYDAVSIPEGSILSEPEYALLCVAHLSGLKLFIAFNEFEGLADLKSSHLMGALLATLPKQEMRPGELSA